MALLLPTNWSYEMIGRLGRGSPMSLSVSCATTTLLNLNQKLSSSNGVIQSVSQESRALPGSEERAVSQVLIVG